jgi:hypothetical protein
MKIKTDRFSVQAPADWDAQAGQLEESDSYNVVFEKKFSDKNISRIVLSSAPSLFPTEETLKSEELWDMSLEAIDKFFEHPVQDPEMIWIDEVECLAADFNFEIADEVVGGEIIMAFNNDYEHMFIAMSSVGYMEETLNTFYDLIDSLNWT